MSCQLSLASQGAGVKRHYSIKGERLGFLTLLTLTARCFPFSGCGAWRDLSMLQTSFVNPIISEGLSWDHATTSGRSQ
jgi:hypothetical protein